MPISSERGLFSDPAPPVASRRPFAWWRSVWLGLVLALVSVLTIVGLAVQYLVKVQAPQYPKRAKK